MGAAPNCDGSGNENIGIMATCGKRQIKSRYHHSRVFHKLDEIGNNVNTGITGFTTWKKSSDMLPPVEIEPRHLIASKSNTVLSTPIWHLLVTLRL